MSFGQYPAVPAPGFYGVPLAPVAPPPAAAPLVARNPAQRLWARIVPPGLVTAPWISIPAGALIAVAGGLLLTAMGLLLWSQAIKQVAASAGGAGDVSTAQLLLTPGLFQLFALEQHIPLLAWNGTHVTGNSIATFDVPLTGLFLLPAVALTLGGYIAAASDFQQQTVASVLRGILIAPIYAVFCLLIALLGTSTVMSGGQAMTLRPSLAYALIYGLLWGALFGALGGWIAVSGGAFLSGPLGAIRKHPAGLIAGALGGAGVAFVCGWLLASVALGTGVAGQVLSGVGAPSVPAAPGAAGGAASPLGVIGSLLVVICLILVMAPLASFWLFVLGTGATLDTFASSSLGSLGSRSEVSTFGLLAAGTHPPNAVWYPLLLIPLVSYLIGGRVAARMSRAATLPAAALAGAAIAPPLALLMLAGAFLTGLRFDLGEAGIRVTSGITLSLGAVFLLTLVISAILGTAGGASLFALPTPAAILERPLQQLRPLVNQLPVARYLRRADGSLSGLRLVLALAVVLAAAFAALTIVAVVLTLIVSRVAPSPHLQWLPALAGGLLVGLPLLLLASAVIALLLRLPPAAAPRPAARPSIYATVPAGPPGAPAPYAGTSPATPGWPPVGEAAPASRPPAQG